MYTEERKGSLLKQFILRLILIIIFVLLLIWLVPWPNMNSYIDALNPLKSQIFNANIQEMKDAAILYYTAERLPENVGDKKTLTLQQMLDLKLLVPFVDKDGNSCDVTASYVTIEKKETEYLMKVNLKCGMQEDYILVHVGCYAYCTTDICEKEETKVVKPVSKPTNTPTVKPTSKPTLKPTSTPTLVPTMKPTPTPTAKPTPTPTAKPTPTPTSKPTPTPTAKPTPTPTAKPTPTPTPKPVKQYQYVKTTPAYCANWGNWNTKMLKTGETLKVVNNIYNVVEDLGEKRVQVGVKSAVYQKVFVKENVLVQSSTYTYKVCKNYDYIITNNSIHQINGGWTYTNEYHRGYQAPTNTATVYWVFQGVDFNQCGTSCTSNPYGIWRKMVRSTTSLSVGTVVTADCVDIETRSIPVYINTIQTTEKTVLKTPEQPLYGNIHFYREKSCLDVREKTSDYLWSTYNDKNLLDNGYTYTGETRYR